MTKKYSKTAQKEIKKEMHHYKEGSTHSGKGKQKVTSRKQAIAIGLSKARKQGAKAPQNKNKKA